MESTSNSLKLGFEFKQKTSIVEMMKPGMTPDSFAKLRKEWLEPIEARIKELAGKAHQEGIK